MDGLAVVKEESEGLGLGKNTSESGCPQASQQLPGQEHSQKCSSKWNEVLK